MLSADEYLKTHERLLIAVDGRCASGKTTFAREFQGMTGCAVFHADDFFLPPEKRTEKRLSEPGGNMDRERFLSEVIIPFLSGKPFSYSPYDCHEGKMSPEIPVAPCRIGIAEGSYSCHPELWNYYGLHVFLGIDGDEQRKRVLLRNPENSGMFFKRWIPLEERYFSEFSIKSRSEFVFIQKDKMK